MMKILTMRMISKLEITILILKSNQRLIQLMKMRKQIISGIS